MSENTSIRDTRHAISGLFSFVLFAFFTLMMLLMVIISAQSYRKTVERGEQTAQLRTAMGYIEGKVLTSVGKQSMYIDTVAGSDALFITYVDDEGDKLVKAIYCADGMLSEQYYVADETDFDPDFGTPIASIQSLALAFEGDGLLNAKVTDSFGQSLSLRMRVNAGTEVRK